MPPLVTPAWVSDRLGTPELILLDATLPPVGVTPAVDTHARYLATHLPGALFFDIEALSDRSSSLPHTLPSPERFAQNMSALGVHDGATIVVYEQGDVFSAPRARWTLQIFGASRVSLLDGGLQAWIAAGLPTEAGPVYRAPAVFHAKLGKDAVRDFGHIQQLLGGRATPQILDARSSGRFDGTAPEPRAGLRSGHMPRANNIPYTQLIDGPRMKPAEELRAVFAQKDVDLYAPITTTCGSGVTAAVIALGLEICGAHEVSLYDGSWAEYAQQPGAVIEGNR